MLLSYSVLESKTILFLFSNSYEARFLALKATNQTDIANLLNRMFIIIIYGFL